MSSLNNRDLERFSWEKMAPGIDEKMKKKKKRAFFFKLFISLLLVFVIVGISTVVWYSMENHQDENRLEATTKTEDYAYGINCEEQEELDKEEKHIEAQLFVKQETNDDLSNERRALVDDNSFGLNPNKNVAKKKDSSSRVNINMNNSYESNTTVSKELSVKDKVSFDRKSSESVINFRGILNDSSRIDSFKIVNDSLLKTWEINFYKHKYVIQKIAGIDMIPMKQLRRRQSLEIAYNTNYLTKHPHEARIGNGLSLGYSIRLKGNHYLGFEYKYQRLRYDFISPIYEIDSENVHQMYNLPLFYSYKKSIASTAFSMEVGANINIFRQSTGKISAIGNELAIIDIQEENYFRNPVGTSLIGRVKVEQYLMNSIGVFARLGVDWTPNNWYKNDNYTISPVIYNLDFGTYILF